MLIYNFQKEFLGIDEKDLKTLGFHTLSELRAEVTDFADLFVKTPGYVHNFKHVHWIDFVNYADVSEESKVLINVNSKTFKATLSVSPLFLIDNPASPAYIIHLNNLRPLSKSENDNLSSDILDRELPKVAPQEPKVFTPAPEVAAAVHDNYDIAPEANIPEPVPEPYQAEEQISIEDEVAPIEVTQNFDEPLSMPEHEEETLDVGDLSLDVFEEEIEAPATPTPEPFVEPAASDVIASTKPVKKVVKKELAEEWDNGYQYDPHIASKELGLPLDLIEEFIQDFIAQAKEFKPDIDKSIAEGDVNNVKILSHKLKGVAANLRIEDAHEVLSAVSATGDMAVIEDNLDVFYKIIAKLAGEPIEKVVVVEEEIEESVAPVSDDTEINIESNEQEETISLDFKDDDEVMTNTSSEETAELSKSDEEEDFDIALDFKDDEDIAMIDIEDKDVPEKIDMPELADDDFLVLGGNENTEQEIPQFSKAQAAQEIGIDEASFNELFDDFVNESHQIFQKINSAISNDDLGTCRNEALKFKGMSDNMRLHEFTNELETLIHSSDKDEIIAAAQKIDATINKISEIGA
ncbi:Hpt domain-containing protein [Sulfurimonas indica]|uniref:Hpt domain-containing protein n=1 Tax=Sulfurimonas indica TaxID=2508707 RepID=UPI001265A1C0|nr:Hpt domain-containing protein [Sulfurimonas indica]